MTIQILSTRSSTLASLNPNLLHRTQTSHGSSDYSLKYPFNGDFTGFSDVKENLVAHLTLLDKFAAAPLEMDRDQLFERIKLALGDALKLPSKLREQVLKTFFDKMSKGLPAPSSQLGRDASRAMIGASSSLTQLAPVAVLAKTLQDKLAPMGLRSQVLSDAIGTRGDTNAHRPRWSLNFGGTTSAKSSSK